MINIYVLIPKILSGLSLFDKYLLFSKSPRYQYSLPKEFITYINVLLNFHLDELFYFSF